MLLEESSKAKLNVIQYRFECHHSNTDCMNSPFKVHFMISVLILSLIFIEEIEPCQFEIQNFSVASSVKF